MLFRCVLVLFFFWIPFAYLEFSLTRIPHDKSFPAPHLSCINDIPKADDSEKDQDDDDVVQDSNNYKEICYEKDISYVVELYNKQDQLLLISMDTTTPISWLKGNRCHIGSTHKKCTKAQASIGEKLKQMQNKLATLWNSQQNSNKKSKKNELALIKGSTEVVKGVQEKAQNLTFQTRDIGRLARMKDIFLIGLGLIDENHEIQLKQTNFISATKISPNLNYLCDGAVSLRFDEQSQSSFLKEMIEISQSSSRQKYVTIYSGQNSSIMIGDISVKHSRQGFTGITWIQTKVDQQYGRLPSLQNFAMGEPNSDSHKTIKTDLPAVFTISSSSIHIPADQLEEILKKFFKGKNCTVNEQTRFVQCANLGNSQNEKQLVFGFNELTIGLTVESLILKKSHKTKTLNIKRALDNNFVILGEPIFQKYLIILDFVTNKIGVSLQNEKPYQQIINVVSLLRVVVWALIIMCCVVLLTNPIDRCKKILSERPIAVPYEYPYAATYIKTKRYSPLEEEVQEEKRTESQM